MRKLIVALASTTAVCLASAAVAFADAAPPPTQGVGQSANTSQLSGAASSAVQVQPTNTNISLRIFSPGNDGDVTQTNSVDSSANAGNLAGTSQSANQSGSGSQGVGQSATTDQAALALSEAKQIGASNTNIPVRIFSKGDNGSVTQSNTADSTANAGNEAWTGQHANQGSGSSCGCEIKGRDATTGSGNPITTNPPPSTSSGGGSGTQGVGQIADTQQVAGAASKAVQIDPSNSNISVRIFSPGNDGDVSQTNSVNSTANAGNAASTEQRASQGQASDGCGCAPKPKPKPCGCDSAPKQWDQPDATSDPTTQSPTDSSNGYSPESNQPSADSAAAPASSPATGVQGVGQQASTDQLALAGSEADQVGAQNVADPVRIGSWGNGGDVEQTNSVSSDASAGNEAKTHQNADQSGNHGSSCGCGGNGVQGIGQTAETAQGSLAQSKAVQDFGGHKSSCGCESNGGSGNNASPVRIGSPGTDGDLTQSNTVDSTANAGNKAHTSQHANQSGGGGGTQVQGIGQQATTLQAAFAASLALQKGASNDASPVRIFSPGGGGSVEQSNSASSEANAGNEAKTRQRADQDTGGHKECGCRSVPIQGIGQQAGTDQFGFAGSGAFQLYPRNVSDPLRIKSPDSEKKKDHGSDGKGSYPDGKGSYPDGKGSYPDGKGSYPDGKGSYPDGKGSYPDGKGSYPDGKGSFSGREGLVSQREGLVYRREGLISGRWLGRDGLLPGSRLGREQFLPGRRLGREELLPGRRVGRSDDRAVRWLDDPGEHGRFHRQRWEPWPHAPVGVTADLMQAARRGGLRLSPPPVAQSGGPGVRFVCVCV